MASDAPSVLRKIVAHKREEVAAAKAVRPRIDVEGLPPTRGFAAAIARMGRRGSGKDEHEHEHEHEPAPDTPRPTPVRLIAEVKHASPVKGVLRADFDAVALGATY